jgi:hypothetical protein
MSTDTQELTAVIGRSVRAIVATFRRPAKPHPELYGLSAGHVDSAAGGKELPSKPDASSDRIQATQANLPIGPSCC